MMGRVMLAVAMVSCLLQKTTALPACAEDARMCKFGKSGKCASSGMPVVSDGSPANKK